MKKTIIWDWNGTLLDDMNACVEAINILLRKRRMRVIDLERYRNEFVFPVIDYYKAMGFDLERERFDTLAEEYTRTYQAAAECACLQEGAAEMLRLLKAEGCRQIVLSAMESTALKKQVDSQGIRHYFDEIIGSDTIYAHGKIQIAKNYFQKKGDPAERVIIGDTYHDYEVAGAIDCPCVLVNNGHQNLARFVFDDRTRIAGSLLELAPCRL
ncbi:MAG TPA: HAD hydrolase-like protein [Acidobacteriota bacterium]|nr:HAD hydrolase-like protein [Acidobacteriota bacterium]